jgi:hypothetical protein
MAIQSLSARDARSRFRFFWEILPLTYSYQTYRYLALELHIFKKILISASEIVGSASLRGKFLPAAEKGSRNRVCSPKSLSKESHHVADVVAPPNLATVPIFQAPSTQACSTPDDTAPSRSAGGALPTLHLHGHQYQRHGRGIFA